MSSRPASPGVEALRVCRNTDVRGHCGTCKGKTMNYVTRFALAAILAGGFAAPAVADAISSADIIGLQGSAFNRQVNTQVGVGISGDGKVSVDMQQSNINNLITTDLDVKSAVDGQGNGAFAGSFFDVTGVQISWGNVQRNTQVGIAGSFAGNVELGMSQQNVGNAISSVGLVSSSAKN